MNLGNTLGQEAGMEVVTALATNKTVQKIRLDGNILGPEAGKELAKSLASNQTVQFIKYALPPSAIHLSILAVQVWAGEI